jgi:protein CpxP
MNRLILPAALAFALTGTLAAQQPPAPIVRNSPDAQSATAPADPQSGQAFHHHHRPSAHREAMMLTHRLNLTPDQAARIEPILADRDQKTSALFADNTLNDQARHQQMHAIHKSAKEQLDAVLTPEQRDQMKSMHQGHHARGDQQNQPLTPPPAA